MQQTLSFAAAPIEADAVVVDASLARHDGATLVRTVPEDYHPPYLCRRLRLIVTGSKVLDSEGRIAGADWIFEEKTDVPWDVQRVHPVFGDVIGTMCFYVTEHNIRAMMDLPGVPLSEKSYMLNLLIEYVYRPHDYAMQAQVLRATLDVKQGTAHRVPVTIRRELRERPLTQKEKTAKMFGFKVEPTYEEVLVKEEIPDVMEFQRYSNYRLYSHQLIGAWAFYHARHYALWFEMRVGKTLTTIVTFKRLLAEGKCDVMIVVCPRINMWHPWVGDLTAEHLRCVVLDGNKDQDESLLASGDYDVIILNYERVQSRHPLLDYYLDERKYMLVYDESTAIKEMSASRTEAAHALAFDASWSICLNGTPASQGPDSLYGQYRVIDPYGLRFGPTFNHYSGRFLERSGYKWEIAGGPSATELESLIMTSSLRVMRFEADQFNGKDKQFRYIQMRPTKQMKEQAKNIAKGFSRTMVDGAVKEGKVKDMVLVIYGMLRELACGYDKFQEAEGLPYRRVRHSVDPKVLWVKCFLTAHPDEALVIYTEFNEQEQVLKETLDEMGIKWAARKPRAKVVKTRVVRQVLDYGDWLELCLLRDHDPDSCLTTEDGGYIVPEALRYEPAPDRLTEVEECYIDGTQTNLEDAKGIDDFNNGEVQVYIMKTKQGKGMSLHRKEAHRRGVGDYPSIVRLAPSWSLDAHQQSGDRCVCVDDKTGKNVCTMEYMLFMPGMEKRIVDALRKKADVQKSLLKDAEDEGYESFINTLVEEMSGTREEGDELFDVQDTLDRIECGVPPVGKITRRVIDRCVKGRTYDMDAYNRLMAKVTE